MTLLFDYVAVYVIRCNLQSAADMDHRPRSEMQKTCLTQNTAMMD